jgi:hypothetical protein
VGSKVFGVGGRIRHGAGTLCPGVDRFS